MIVNKFNIHGIPAMLWGDDSSRLIIAAHGSQSSKTDDCMWILAKEAAALGYQTLSFDFPRHGDRKDDPEPCMVQECVKELKDILAYARQKADKVYVFGCSMGAYFSLLAYGDEPIEHALFLSPVTDMERIIQNMMNLFDVTEERLKRDKTVETPMETLYWDYYCYVKDHPVDTWDHPTSILYGEHDTLCEYKCVSAFAEQFGCNLEVHKGGEHWFHTPEELEYYRGWVRRRLEEIRSCNCYETIHRLK